MLGLRAAVGDHEVGNQATDCASQAKRLTMVDFASGEGVTL
jgi:hypothetical protein